MDSQLQLVHQRLSSVFSFSYTFMLQNIACGYIFLKCVLQIIFGEQAHIPTAIKLIIGWNYHKVLFVTGCKSDTIQSNRIIKQFQDKQ